ncbi:hypothetical protein XENTR_v10012654 [Xenopus tropicalis]|nr:hypothetical protein XENTR_v10012654 [Xenopus tropicalis]
MLKNMMVRHLGTEKDVDPEILWKSVLRGTGKRTGPEINEKLSAIPKPSLEKQMLNKQLKEHFQKHPDLGSKCAILTGVGTSDELLLNPEVIPILPNPTLTRTYKPPKEKSFVTREKLRPIIDEMQARSLRQMTEKANKSQPAKSEKDEPQEDRQNRIERSPSLTFHEIIDTFNKQERKE